MESSRPPQFEDQPVKVIVEQYCMVCHRLAQVEMDIHKYVAWTFDKVSLQKLYPEWTAAKREMAISGTHPECWDKLFAEEE